MKRIATMALAAATFMTPLAAPQSAAAYDGRVGHDGYHGRDHDGRWDRDDRRDRRHDRWDRRRYNGYHYNGRWHYGPPPSAYYGRPGFYPGYRDWRRGEVLPYHYRSYYPVVDWRRHHLHRPPYGYHYVRDDRGAILLVGIATGVILSAILSD
jgi:Ni/Co efflux regulator RcnB